jgi:hypothetical protein
MLIPIHKLSDWSSRLITLCSYLSHSPHVYIQEAANTAWSSWRWAVCRSKHVEPSINFVIINSVARWHSVSYFYWFTLWCTDPWILNLRHYHHILVEESRCWHWIIRKAVYTQFHPMDMTKKENCSQSRSWKLLVRLFKNRTTFIAETKQLLLQWGSCLDTSTHCFIQSHYFTWEWSLVAAHQCILLVFISVISLLQDILLFPVFCT